MWPSQFAIWLADNHLPIKIEIYKYFIFLSQWIFGVICRVWSCNSSPWSMRWFMDQVHWSGPQTGSVFKSQFSTYLLLENKKTTLLKKILKIQLNLGELPKSGWIFSQPLKDGCYIERTFIWEKDLHLNE